MYIRSAVSCCFFGAVSLLSGCAYVPELPTDAQVNAQDVIRAIRCEIRAAYNRAEIEAKDGARDLRGSGSKLKFDLNKVRGFYHNRQYTIALNLKVEDKGTATASAGFVVPISVVPPQAVTVTPDIGIDGTNTRSAEFKFTDRFPSTDCSPPTTQDGESWLLGGSVGLEEWLNRVKQTADHPSLKASSFGTITYTLSFVVKPNAGVGVSYVLVPTALNALNGSGAFGFDKTKTHSLTITLDTFDPSPPEGQNVIVANFGQNARAVLRSVVTSETLKLLYAQLRKLEDTLANLPDERARNLASLDEEIETKEKQLKIQEEALKSLRETPEIQNFTQRELDAERQLSATKDALEDAQSARSEAEALYNAMKAAAELERKTTMSKILEAEQTVRRTPGVRSTRRARDLSNQRRSEQINDLAIIKRRLDELTLE